MVDAEPIAVVAERTGRILLKTLHEVGGVAGLSAAHEAVSAHHGNNYTPLMERFYRSHRAGLFELEPASTDHCVLDAVAVLRANRARTGEYIPDHHEGRGIDLSFAGQSWQATLRTGVGRASWGGGNSRCACSLTWPPSWAPGTSP